MKKHKKQKEHINFIKYFLTPRRGILLLLIGFILYFFLTNPIQIKDINAIIQPPCDCIDSATTVYQLPELIQGGDCGVPTTRYTLPFTDVIGTSFYTLPAVKVATRCCSRVGGC